MTDALLAAGLCQAHAVESEKSGKTDVFRDTYVHIVLGFRGDTLSDFVPRLPIPFKLPQLVESALVTCLTNPIHHHDENGFIEDVATRIGRYLLGTVFRKLPRDKTTEKYEAAPSSVCMSDLAIDGLGIFGATREGEIILYVGLRSRECPCSGMWLYKGTHPYVDHKYCGLRYGPTKRVFFPPGPDHPGARYGVHEYNGYFFSFYDHKGIHPPDGFAKERICFDRIGEPCGHSACEEAESYITRLLNGGTTLIDDESSEAALDNPQESESELEMGDTMTDSKCGLTGEALVKAALETVRNREDNRGNTDDNLKTIAGLWSALFGIELTTAQVCDAMIALKLARMQNEKDVTDSLIDTVGYAILRAETSGAKDDEIVPDSQDSI